ncbi:hypothetical protein [Hymenobacter jeollabukensis]|uniref:Uncharacterized protein n=1 Tax=Hymenobacter jeollabukensis TaxID=2025313 RepID=A0A5R8WGV3_9BACT|nr:hypothetical protein [Hymenobacter jeollabukensis]TLM87302.1 hypothetical protein FDY95_26120 [Hymenobacter jeollabukensis]
MAHIILTSLAGHVASNELTPPDPSTIEQYGHLIIQAVVAIVTLWATVRKALQRPETVVKVSADALPLVKSEPTVTAGQHGSETN